MKLTKHDSRNLFKNFSPKFSNRLFTVLLTIAEDDCNISVYPSRLQIVLALLANWANPTILRMILDTIGCEEFDVYVDDSCECQGCDYQWYLEN